MEGGAEGQITVGSCMHDEELKVNYRLFTFVVGIVLRM